ncbi:MAG: hypothetical protein Q9167_006384 [Letrouitia subvulpina]
MTAQVPPSMLALMPGLPPPLGVVPNFENPPNSDVKLNGTFVTCTVITTILVSIRLYTKTCLLKTHGWDDCVHQWNLLLPEVMEWGKVINYEEIYYSPLIFVTKLSILLQFVRIFVPHRKGWLYVLIHLNIWFNLATYTGIFFAIIFSCVPREKIWNPLVSGHCVNHHAILIAGGVINVISDFCILFIPIRQVWQLQMSQKRKIGVSAIFAIGLLACVSSILRLAYSIKFTGTQDLTYHMVPLAVTTVAEIASGIMSGCLPYVPHFFRHAVPKFTSILASYRSKGKTGDSDTTLTANSKDSSKPHLTVGPLETNPLKSTYVVLEEVKSDSVNATRRDDLERG